jgi:hypothetical protein
MPKTKTLNEHAVKSHGTRRAVVLRRLRELREERRKHHTIVDTYWHLDAEGQARWNEVGDSFPESALDIPIPRCEAFPDASGPIEVYFMLNYPLTDDVPQEARESVIKASTVKDVLLEIRRVYEAIYAEDERLGGPVKHPDSMLQNRGFGPWVWGHDLSDLAVEFIEFAWVSPTEAVANVFVGS